MLIEQVRALAERGSPMDVWTMGEEGPQDLVPAVRAASPLVRDVGRLRGTTAVAWTVWRRRYEAVITCWTIRAYRAVHRLRRLPPFRAPVVIETVHERYGWCLEDDRERRRREVDFWMLTYDFRKALGRAFDLPEERMGIAKPLFPSLLPRDPDGARARGRSLRASLGIPETALVVGYAGRLAGNKGHHHFIPMVARLAARGLDVHLVVAGRLAPHVTSYQDRIDAIVREVAGPGRPLSGRLHVLGAVGDAGPVLAASDVVILLSYMEGLLPLMLVEAMGLGVPVVTTDVGGIATCLSDGVDAAVVAKVPDDERDPTPDVIAAFERRLGRLLSDPVERARLAAAGRARVEALVRGNDFHADTLAAYERALSLGRLGR